MSGFKVTSRNPCDFIAFYGGILYLIELKSHLGNTFPLANLTQYDKLAHYAGKPGVRAGMVIWFIDHDKVAYVPAREIGKMMADGKKSVNVKMLSEKSYDILEVPSSKKRVFMDSDYSVMKDLGEGE